MRRAIRTCVGAFATEFGPTDPIVEIGSYFPPGAAWLSDVRPFFRAHEYIGCDIRRGHGVDRLEDAQALSFADRSTGTVLMFEVLEHLPRPHQAVAEACRVLRDDGLLAVSAPFNYRLHGFPTDYWRFTASGMHELLAPFPARVVLSIGPRVKPAFVFAVAAKRLDDEFVARRRRLVTRIEQDLAQRRWKGRWSVFKERSRDLAGLLVGRADMRVSTFEPSQPGGYVRSER